MSQKIAPKLHQLLPTPVITTGLGSLPHPNVDSAIARAFDTTLPYLPQIPIRNPHEFMVAQALHGFPGATFRPHGGVVIDLEVWQKHQHSLEQNLRAALSGWDQPHPNESLLAPFGPSPQAFSCWRPFLWELHERHLRAGKIQLAGPLTCAMVAQWENEDRVSAEACAMARQQLTRFILARALAMTLEFKREGIVPVFFIDEPGLFAFHATHSHQRIPLGIALTELKLTLQTLRKAGAITGLHCCGNTDWKSVMTLDMDILSFDVPLSLQRIFETARPEVDRFLENGGHFCLGVIPTRLSDADELPLTEDLLESFAQKLRTVPGWDESQIQKLWRTSLFSPACGLALHSIETAERVLARLADWARRVEKTRLLLYPF